MSVESLSPYTLTLTEDCFPLGEDSLALASFATLRPGWPVCDLGCGGGTLLLLVMTLLLGVEPRTAQGINLLYFLPTAGMGLLYHRKNGLLDRELLRRTVPWGLLAAAGGALLASIIDVTLLRRIFGIYLLAAGVSMLLPSKKG